MTKADKANEAAALERGAARIHEVRAVLARVAQERERIAGLADNAEHHAGEIARLRQQRAEALAVALVDRGEADVRELDERIDEAERAAREALDAGTVAADALRVLDARRTALEAELTEATKAQLDVAERDLHARHEKALAAFNASVNALQGPLETMDTIAAAIDAVRRRRAELAGNRNWSGGSPGLSFYLRRTLQDEGLRIVREDNRQTWPPGWLSRLHPTTEAREFSQNYFGDAALD
jgi:hypothetical protein